MKILYPLLFTALLGFSYAAAAEGVYKYVKDGKTYYSDQPPLNVDAEQLDSYSDPATGSQPAPETEQDAAKAAIQAHECNKARARLVEYQNSPILIQRNLKGEEQELSAEERIDVIVRAQTDVNDLCGQPAADSETDAGDNDFTAEVEVEG